ncbi:hypothetical protein EMCRGX_G002842 [Ephydatia muelleri]
MTDVRLVQKYIEMFIVRKPFCLCQDILTMPHPANCQDSAASADLDFRGDEALSNCPAPADTSEQSASKADPAIDGNSSQSSDRNKESVAGFDLAKLCDNVRIPKSKRDEAIMLGIPQHPKHFPVDKTDTEFPVTVLRHTS